MVNYQNGMIYKLCCNDLNITDIYIGSTVNFKERKRCHKKACNNINNRCYNLKLYKFIRDNGGWNNWDMVLVAKTPCNSKLELLQFERKYYEELNATLNNNYPGRTPKEYHKDNKEIIKIKRKEYQEANKEYLKIKKKEWQEKNKDIIKIKKKEYREVNKEIIKIKKKEWREVNKEIILIKEKLYREANKEILKIKRALKVNCPICDKFITKTHIKRHQRSKKCIEIGKLI